MKPASECCYAPMLHDGRCSWCGKPSAATEERDELWQELDALLCDWDAPRKLATYDLHATIAKLRQFIIKREKEDQSFWRPGKSGDITQEAAQ